VVFLFASRPEVMGRVLGIVYRCIATRCSRSGSSVRVGRLFSSLPSSSVICCIAMCLRRVGRHHHSARMQHICQCQERTGGEFNLFTEAKARRLGL
jgi:hypothetical protein